MASAYSTSAIISSLRIHSICTRVGDGECKEGRWTKDVITVGRRCSDPKKISLPSSCFVEDSLNSHKLYTTIMIFKTFLYDMCRSVARTAIVLLPISLDSVDVTEYH